MDIGKIRKSIKEFEFVKLFVDGLGWEHPTQKTSSIQFKDSIISYSYIAQINQVPILQFDSCQLTDLNDRSKMKQLHQKIKEQHHEHLLLFQNETYSFTLSYLSKERQVREHSYFKGQSTDDLINKLSNIHFSIEDEPKITDIGKKLEKAFNTEKVTKKFYADFKSNHFNFQEHIFGITDEEDKKWYASVILNRLMFIWFLQKKMFCNDDALYLQTKLEESKTRGKDKYYSEFLTVLFFEGFAKKPKERNEQAKKLLGEIDYLNGGLFVPHKIEEDYKNKIQIKDAAFEKTYKIFQQYDWHVGDEKAGKSTDKDIDPDVLGYIFEKYINELQQKSMGAYYTKDEITNYLSRNTIQNCILEKVNQKGYSFKDMPKLLHKLDAPLCKLLLTNENSILNTLTILDPAVGSGAFLMAAMKKLINIYSPIIGKIETLGDRDLTAWLKRFEDKHKSIAYGIKKNIILKNLYGVDLMKEATEVCKLRLFLSLVAAALNRQELEPLPNIDFNIMHGNSLIGFLKEGETKEQGLLFDSNSYKQVKDRYNKLVGRYKTKSHSFDKLTELKSEINHFLQEENLKLNGVLVNRCKDKGLKYIQMIDIQGKKKPEKRAISKEDFQKLNPFHWDFAFNDIIDQGGFDIIITNPPWDKVENEDREFFHKYDKSIDKKRAKKSIVKQKKEILLKKTNIKKDYLHTEELYLFKRNYFLKLYAYQKGELIDDEINRISPVKNMDTYRLFLERCFDLLSQKGFLGIVLPTGLCKDDGAIGLRRFIFDHIKIEGLIDFQNQMDQGKGRIFEGVHPQFKFLLLNAQKDKPQDEFPCQFHTRDLKVLLGFPNSKSMQQSIDEIKRFSPRDSAIIEFKDPRDRKILKKASQLFPQLKEKVKNLWNCYIYTAEMNETHESYLFQNQKQSNHDLPLYVGKAINQYEFNYDLSHVSRYISTKADKIINRQGFPLKKICYKNYRLVIRTIASNTNERSLITAVIPKNHFISNSLYGIHIEPSQNKYMLLLQAFLNSFVVDYFIRQKVSANINKKYITPLYIPRLTEKDPCFKELVEKSAILTCIDPKFDELADEVGISRGGIKDLSQRWKIQGEIDAIVAHIYKLTLDEFEYILSTFNTGRNKERLQALKKHALESFKQNHLCIKVA